MVYLICLPNARYWFNYFVCVCIPANSLNLSYIIVGQVGIWYVMPLFPCLFFVSFCLGRDTLGSFWFNGWKIGVSFWTSCTIQRGTVYFLAKYLHLLIWWYFIFWWGDYLLRQLSLYSFLFEFRVYFSQVQYDFITQCPRATVQPATLRHQVDIWPPGSPLALGRHMSVAVRHG